jgi:hypothetical protein
MSKIAGLSLTSQYNSVQQLTYNHVIMTLLVILPHVVATYNKTTVVLYFTLADV